MSGPSALVEGDSALFSAVVMDQRQHVITGVPITWASNDTTRARVGPTGAVHAVQSGVVTISATAGGKTGAESLTVLAPAVAVVSVSPSHPRVGAGWSVALAATARDSTLRALPGAYVAWASADSTVARVDAAGRVTGRRPGVARITATSHGVSGSAAVEVLIRAVRLNIVPDTATTYVGRALALTAVVQDSGGDTLRDRPVNWRSGDTSVARVSGDGRVTGMLVGIVSVFATSEGAADTARITVRQTRPTRLSVVAPGTALSVGDSLALTAVVLDSQDRVLTGFPVTWRSLDSTRAHVSGSGIVAGRAVGNVPITASAGDLTDTVRLRVDRPVASVRMVPDTIITQPGRVRRVAFEVRDDQGRTIDGHYIDWRVADTTIAVRLNAVIMTRQAGTTTVQVSTGGVTHQSFVWVVTTAGVGINLYPDSVALTASTQARVTAEVFNDSSGHLIPGQPVSFRSTDTTIFRVTPLDTVSDSTGHAYPLIQTTGPGTATLVASGGSRAYIAKVVSVYAPVTAVRISPRPVLLRSGDTLQLTAEVFVAGANPTPYIVSWSTSDAVVATVSSSGFVTARGPGRTQVVAAVPGKSDTLTLYVQSPAAPLISGVVPALLLPGDTAGISGQNFSGMPDSDVVTIGGARATVESASTTHLTVRIPPAAALPCVRTGPVPVIVAVGAELGETQQLIQVATQRALNVGDTLVLSGPTETRCNEFTAIGARYWLSVVNQGGDPRTTAGFEVLTAAPSPASILARAGAVGAAASVALPGGVGVLLTPARLRQTALAHRRERERSRSLVERAGVPPPTSAVAAPARAPAVSAALSGVSTLRVPLIDLPSYCLDYTEVQARTVYQGTHALVLEDLNAPLAGQMDVLYTAIGAEFDSLMYSVLVQDFGDPLAMDTRLGGPGRVVLLFSPAVNAFGVSSFVTGCDFYPRTMAPSSNQGAVIYALVPTDAATGFDAGLTREVWRWFIRRQLIHQGEHLASDAERLARGAPPEELWLSEALARTAEEIWARRVYGVQWKENATYRATVYCDVRPTWPACADRPYAMFEQFALLYDFFSEIEGHSVLGPTTDTDATFPGGSWLFLRWAVDQYTPSEAAFLRALVREPALTGVGNLEARTGRPFKEMLAAWALASDVDDAGFPITNPRLSYPSWHLRDVFSGMYTDFPGLFTRYYPVPIRSLFYGTSSGPITVAGGSGSVVQPWYDASVGTQFLLLRALGGGAPSPQLRVEVIRIQ